MKKSYLLILFLCPLILFAQKKVDLDRYNFTVQFHSLPAMHLDSTYRTYNIVVEGTKMMQPFLQQLSPANSVILEGWRKLPQDGHITIKVKLEDLLPESVSIKERTENIKNPLGQITGIRILYHEEVVYTFAATAVINDYKGIHLLDELIADRGYKQVYSSPEFPFRKLAEGYFLINTKSTTGELYRSCVNRAMHYLSNRITDNFGFGEVTVNDVMWIVGSKKHPEYAAHRDAFRQLTEVLFSMNANQSIDGARAQLKPVIDYFESMKEKYTSTNKHDRKMRYASYFNLAVLYYYLDDPQAMMKQATGLVLNDYDVRDGKAFEQSASKLKNLFQKANIYTRHFKVDPLSYKGPFEDNTQTVK